MKIKSLSIAMLFLATFTQKSSAQWQATTGPTQPNVVALATSGNNTFAATGAIVSLTTDNGANWSYVNSGLSGSPVYSLATKGTDIFAGGGAGTMYQSSNNGTNWTNTNTGLTPYDVRALVVNGSDIYAGNSAGIYKSTNNGLLWTLLNQTWSTNVLSIAISGNTILAGTINTGIQMSTDNGTTWNTINTGLPNQVNAVAILGTTFLAGTTTGIYKSTNNGVSWSISNITNSINCITKIGSNIFAGTGNAGVVSSTDNGSTWSSINTGLSNLTVYSIASNSNYIFAGTAGLVFKRLLSEVLPSTITTASNPTIGGATTGSGNYTNGTSVTLTATPNTNYIFSNWTENGSVVSTSNPYTFNASADRNIVAEFTLSTSIKSTSNQDLIKIYPNPNNGQFTISSDKLFSNIKIYNSIGQLTFTKENVSGQIQCDINEKGIYLIVAQERNSDKTYKQNVIIK